MAKELPYFKFEPNQWENGNIQIVSREDKGLFMDLCSMYWSRLGDLPLKLAIQKLCGGNAVAFINLIDNEIFSIVNNDICIDFLNEQLLEFENTSIQNSKNAKEGWEKRKINKLSDRIATASISQSENDAIREEKIIEDKEDKKKIIFNLKKNLLEIIKDDILVSDYISLRKSKKASMSETFFNSLKKECDDNNFDLAEALKICIDKSWVGFKYTWVKNIELQNKEKIINGKSNTTAKPTYRNTLTNAFNNSQKAKFSSLERELSQDTVFTVVE